MSEGQPDREMEETECAEDWLLSIVRECCGAIEMRKGETVTGCKPEPRDNGHPLIGGGWR